MKAYITTLGCKVNQYESQILAQELRSDGYEIVPDANLADICVVNSCTVTAQSDRKTRQAVRHLKKLNENAVLVLTGCMPQAGTFRCDVLPEADIILGNNSNGRIIEALNTYFAHPAQLCLTQPHENDEPFTPCKLSDFYGRTRANVKIEDGCNRFCSYCIIPYARGRVRSKPLFALKDELSALNDAGFREVVLVGINLSAYRDGEYNLCDAAQTAASFDNIARVRLGSLEPDHLTAEFINRLALNKKLCPQFHISLQSGCDKTLRAMNRHYTSREYLELCHCLRSRFDECTLTTDVMVGFPGESDEDFARSLEFVQLVGFEKVHVFPYSRRQGTPAAKMEGQLSAAVKQQRVAAMLDAASKIRSDFLQRQTGKTVEVLVESALDGVYEGYTANYIPVKLDTACTCGELVKVKIVGATDDCCTAVQIKSNDGEKL